MNKANDIVEKAKKYEELLDLIVETPNYQELGKKVNQSFREDAFDKLKKEKSDKN